MLLNGGTLDDRRRLLRRKTVELMMMNHLSGLTPAHIPGLPGTGFGLGGSVLLDPALRGWPGSVGPFGRTGASPTAFFVDPREQLPGILLAQHLQRDLAHDLPRLNPHLVQQALN